MRCHDNMQAQQRREETREGILEAANHLFISYGYDATGVAAICQKAGVSKGAFYHHFESKEAVFLALMDIWLSRLERSLEAVAKDAKTIPDSLTRMAYLVKDIFSSDIKRISFLLELWTRASRDERIREAAIAPYRKYRDIFARLIEQGIVEGTLKPVEPFCAAQAILSLASGIFFQGLVDPEGADWGKVALNSIEILLDGMKRR